MASYSALINKSTVNVDYLKKQKNLLCYGDINYKKYIKNENDLEGWNS